MSPDLAIATILGLILGFIAATVWYAVRWNDEHAKAQAGSILLAELRKEYDQLMLQKSPLYQVRTDGVDPVAVRNPHPVIEDAAEWYEKGPWGAGAGETVQVGEADKWNPISGEYE